MISGRPGIAGAAYCLTRDLVGEVRRQLLGYLVGVAKADAIFDLAAEELAGRDDGPPAETPVDQVNSPAEAFIAASEDEEDEPVREETSSTG